MSWGNMILVEFISIHALRVEGDFEKKHKGYTKGISIHALRVEGDVFILYSGGFYEYFYPRPPGGGRRT